VRHGRLGLRLEEKRKREAEQGMARGRFSTALERKREVWQKEKPFAARASVGCPLPSFGRSLMTEERWKGALGVLRRCSL
jgi:hypothetical protein